LAEGDLELAAAVDTAFSEPAARDSFGIAQVPLFDSLDECLATVEADVAVDFTRPDAVFDSVIACLDRKVHCVVGTTGLDADQLGQIESHARESGVNCLVAPNFAIGAVLLMEVARQIIKFLPECEIIELHHDQKLDAPSGTALRTADLLAAARDGQRMPPGPENHPARGDIHHGIPIHSVRLPGLVAHQEVIFGATGQTLSIRHDSISRDSFMPGVVLAVRRVAELGEPLVVGLENVM
jgi:4-hydroxy-tetrahydrodipicolinate reductase